MSEEAPLKSQKKVMPLWFKVVSGLALLALVCVTAGIIFTESWADVVTYQLDAIKKGDVDKAYNEYTSESFRKVTSLKQFQEFIDAHPAFINVESAFFTKRSIKDHLRTLRGHLLLHDHETIPIEYRLIKENGEWKIQSIRLLKTRKMNQAKSNASLQLTP